MRRNLLSKYFENLNPDDTNGRKLGSGDDSGGLNKRDLEQNDRKLLQRLEIQCELNAQGASDLVVDLFMSDVSLKVFKETVLLSIALLEGGNTNVQVSSSLKNFITIN